ncbi:hypothetical protein ACJJIL_17520 [Microbulbifer sp. EKSA005]|uniref:hypothetical protein n=1 Tax=Microbulbifer sp. EKSA005 TaxID=3243364 RepID=UPI004041FA32
MKKLVLIGTSNGLIRGGISSALSEFFDLTNLSIGASCSGCGLFQLGENIDVIKAADFVLIDFSINDNEHLLNSWIDEEHLNEVVRILYEEIIKININVFSLIMPTLNYLKNYSNSQGRKIHRRIAEELSIPVIDGYEYINGIVDSFSLKDEDLFLDNAHLNREVAFCFGISVSTVLYSLDTLLKIESDFKSQKICQYLVVSAGDLVSQFDRVELKGTSTLKLNAVTLNEKVEIDVSRPGFFLSGLLINANSKAKVRISNLNSDFHIIKNAYSGELPDNKVQIKYMPINQPVDASHISIRVSSYYDQESELSPKGKKVLSSRDYGELDVFGLVYLNAESTFLQREIEDNSFQSHVDSIVTASVLNYMLEIRRLKFFRDRLSLLNNPNFQEADLYRELSLASLDVGDVGLAREFILRARSLRPSGEWIKSISNKLFNRCESGDS